jgi:hypothetical protein
MKIFLLIFKWLLFIIGCALASLIVYNISNVPRIIFPNGLEYPLFWAAWIGWGAVSYFSRERELLDEYSKSHQFIHQFLYFLLYLAVFGVTLLAVFYVCNSIPNPALSLPEADLNMPKVNISPPINVGGGLGQPIPYSPEMYQPEMHKSDDFNGSLDK